MEKYRLSHLDQLEAESIHIFREVFAACKNPVLLYSIGKDSSVLLHLAQKAFAPGKIPFPLMHVNTGFKFPEMIEFRDRRMKETGSNLVEEMNLTDEALALGAEDAHTDRYIYLKKTVPLLEGIKKHGFDAAIGGARREEEKARAKERVFSVRGKTRGWDPKNQRPELWHTYNSNLNEGETLRIFPLSNWTEKDIWDYIKRESIEIVPLYFAEERDVVRRHNQYIRVDNFTELKEGEEVIKLWCRYRTLGCAPSTGAIESKAKTLDEIIEEIEKTKLSERQTRVIDQGSDSAMEDKKREGYF